MTEKPVKILEIEGKDWMSGISLHPSAPFGGLFRELTNFDPSTRLGVYVPTAGPTEVDTANVVTSNLKFQIPFVSASVATIYGFADATKVYAINTLTGVAVDRSSFIKDIDKIKGIGNYKSRVVYASTDTLYSNTMPLVSQVTILAGLTSTAYHVTHVGPDRNLWVTNANHVAKVTNATGKTGNTAQYLTFEDDVIIRGIKDDGQNLIIVGDTNTATPFGVGIFRCFVAFWNMKSQDLTRIWEFKDNAINGVEITEDEVIVIGSSNIYTCNVDSRIKVLQPMKGNASLSPGTAPAPGSIIRRPDGIVMWANGTTMWGYGRISSSVSKTFFTGYTISAGSEILSAVISGDTSGVSGDFSLFVTADNNEVYYFDLAPGVDVGNASTLVTTELDFKRPYKFAFARVILRRPLSSGTSIKLEILSDGGNNYVYTDSVGGAAARFNFTNFGADSFHIWWPAPLSTSPTASTEVFESLERITITNTGAQIQRFELWAYPLRQDQDLYT